MEYELPTVTVKHETLGRVVINRDDFDPKIHQLYDEGSLLSDDNASARSETSQIVDLSVVELRPIIAAIDNVEMLRDMMMRESHAAIPRMTVIKLLQARINGLSKPSAE